jgi:CBS-domain-containing membrane protein
MVKRFSHVASITSVSDSVNLRTVAELMQEKAIGCVVVVDGEDHPVGIVTDRDLALRAVAWSHDPKTTTVAKVMTTPVHTVSYEASLEKMFESMRRLGVRRIPVVDDGGRAVGIVALDDLFETLSAQFEDLSEAVSGARRQARIAARTAHVRHDIHESLDHIRSKLQYASWHAQEAFLHEIDEVRSRVAQALKRD